VQYVNEDGYAVINRRWKKNDVVGMDLPMEVRRVVSRPELKANEGRVAIQYGPLVYCIEGKDNNGKALNMILPDDAKFTVNYQDTLLGGVNTIDFDGAVADITEEGRKVVTIQKKIRAIPYHTWNNRGPGEMLVWIPTTFKDVRINY
jgi:DUF1680 family protein